MDSTHLYRCNLPVELLFDSRGHNLTYTVRSRILEFKAGCHNFKPQQAQDYFLDTEYKDTSRGAAIAALLKLCEETYDSNTYDSNTYDSSL